MEPVLQLPTEIEIRGFEDLSTLLEGEVFHVTTLLAYEAIRATGFVQPNSAGAASPFGNTSNGYFRLRDCVSLFDYRAFGTAEWDEHAHKCLPTLPLRAYRSIVILLLEPEEYPKLVPWSLWKEEEAWSARVVPHVEVGYPGPLLAAAIKSVVVATLAVSPCP